MHASHGPVPQVRAVDCSGHAAPIAVAAGGHGHQQAILALSPWIDGQHLGSGLGFFDADASKKRRQFNAGTRRRLYEEFTEAGKDGRHHVTGGNPREQVRRIRLILFGLIERRGEHNAISARPFGDQQRLIGPIEQAFDGLEFHHVPGDGELAEAVLLGREGVEIWPWLLMAALVLLGVEQVVANRGDE